MKKIIKTSLLLSIIVLSLSTIGCSDIDSQDKNNHEINNNLNCIIKSDKYINKKRHL